MKISPHATVIPFLVMVDREQCPSPGDSKHSSVDDYTYYFIRGSHSTEARRQLIKEYPLTPFFKFVECVGRIEEGKWESGVGSDK